MGESQWKTETFDPLRGMAASPVAEDILIEHARIWDGSSETVMEGLAVLVSDGRITGVVEGPLLDLRGRRIDGTGATLFPGFIDTHVHMKIGRANV